MYCSFKTHTHFSLLNSSARAEQIAKRCDELGYDSCAITDIFNLSGSVEFSEELKKKNKKPIHGCVFWTANGYITLVAKNLAGWKQLIKLVSHSNGHMVSYTPALTLDEVCEAGRSGNLIAITGGAKSTIRFNLSPDEDLHKLESAFGADSVFLQIDRSDKNKNSVNNGLHALSNRCIAAHPVYYTSTEDANLHRILLASSAKSTIKKINDDISKGAVNWYNEFFRHSNYYLPSLTQLKDFGYTDEEIANTKVLSDMCENYSILNRPSLPKFSCPNDMTESEYLRYLCAEGWKKKFNPAWDKQLYGDRVKKELQVIRDANLEGYFLIVNDFVKYGYDSGWLMGPGRGSAAGAIVSYLTGITTVDPIPFDLLFERFYNSGRNTKDRVSYPDIDIDVPVHKRKELINYIKSQYGTDRVCHIATFGSLQGKGAIKEVLRVNNVCEPIEIDRITANIPPEFQIADALEDSGETSVLRWTLENDPDALSDWVFMNEDGSLGGEYAQYFSQAISLEGVYKSRGKHPSGIIISPTVLDETCPMMWDPKEEEKIAGLSMNDLEKIGLVKFDVLGLLALDKLMGVRNLLLTGKVEI